MAGRGRAATLADVDAHAHTVQGNFLFTQEETSGVGDCVAFFRLGVATDQLAFFEEGQGGVDHPGAGAIGAVEQSFDLADQVVAMARLFGDQRRQEDFQIARGKDPGPPATALAAWAFLEAVAAVTGFTVGMMVSHCHALCGCLRHNVRYIL